MGTILGTITASIGTAMDSPMMTTALGWLGTLLVLASYAQPSVIRLRQVSLAASVVLITFNLLLGIWSNLALEVALVGINIEQLRRSRLPAH